MDFETFPGFLYPQTDLAIHKQRTRVVLQMETKLLQERTIKVAVIGHASSGKRSFITRLLHRRYESGLSPMISFHIESSHEIRNNTSIIWVWMIFPGTETYLKNCLESLQDAEAVIICRDCKADDEDDETFFRTMKETIRKVTQHASIFAVYTKNDRQSMEYEPYPPNLLKGIHHLGMTSAKLYTGFDGILDTIYKHLPMLPYRMSIEDESYLASDLRSCCCFM